ncbi:hypothetical protein SAMN04487958_107170 [Vreelandella subterranea]|uniref:Uncharacterized protein n=1 Tax=Vreelandella subterranea TaxID=416874 RepID=A0A1H9UQX4_9GAMM|nr:hypothetical protein [Halomonas subterranea]SES11940.1 hypothetical protein SAMN04487958_107170 [Halomonas subterranea]
MSKLLRRIAIVIRLTRAGRGAELDRVVARMEQGGHFEGAVGEMLFALMPCRKNGWLERSLRGGDNRLTSEELQSIGRGWAHRVQRYVKATRHRSSSGGE